MGGTNFLHLAVRLSGGATEAEWRSAVSRAAARERDREDPAALWAVDSPRFPAQPRSCGRKAISYQLRAPGRTETGSARDSCRTLAGSARTRRKRHTLWRRKGRMPGAFTTCWATSRNGATTSTTRRPTRRAPTGIRGDRTRGNCASFVAGRGIRRPQAAGRRPARRKAPVSRTPVLPGAPLASAACAGRERRDN